MIELAAQLTVLAGQLLAQECINFFMVSIQLKKFGGLI
jgi:hypothetical protein